MTRIYAAGAIFAALAVAPGRAHAQNSHGKAEIKHEVKHDVSPPLNSIPPRAVKPGQPKEKPLLVIPSIATSTKPDTAVQSSAGTLVGTTSGLSFLGVGTNFVGPQGAYAVGTAPSDVNGAPGPTQYVQWVNTAFAIFDKATGNVLYGPAEGNTLWTGFGGACEADNDGDILVKYDRAAGRWVLSQVAASGGPPFYQCVAVSTSADATGSYNRYAFQFTNLNDYPKIGVWPDGYYLSINQFSGTTFLGADVCAMDRNAMVQGLAATIQCFPLATSYGAVLPGDLDGATAPPTGSPDFFVGFGTNLLHLWRFHVDFANPANSALTGPFSMAVAAFSQPCNGGGTCIVQPSTTQKLDSLGDRLMYRLAYRNFGDHEALVVNHSVTSGKSVAVRWYELRSPSGTPTVYQQGTYAPDTSFRWMGSIAMDKLGDIALGYSVSSTKVFPAIRYTGRVPSDALGTMELENSIIPGGGSQLPYFGQPLSRWGDYTSMAVDPSDDCTFWYTNQYLISSGSFNWSTRIASFAFPSCTATGPTPDFVLSTTPASKLLPVGSSTSFSATLTPSGGFSGTASFSVSGLPAGATASFNPPTLAGSGSTTMTVTTSAATLPGNYPLTITATSGSLSHSNNVVLTLYVPATASFIRPDTSTQGSWEGVYGSDGYAIANFVNSYPAYAQVNIAGEGVFTWSSSTTDVRALQKPGATDRVASTWYSGTSFTIDINLTDGKAHRVALYGVDWDNQGRAETITLTDAVGGNTVDTESLSGFSNGEWLVWNLSGHVTMQVTLTGKQNAVVSGVFFDPAAGPDFYLSATPSSQNVARGASANYTVTVNSSAGFNGVVNLSASGVPSGATASFSPASVTGSGTSTLTLATGTAALGSYPITITGTSGSLTHSTNVTLGVYVPNAAAFVKTDTTTQGTWEGVYGADGYAIANYVNNYPAYATASVSGQSNFTWASSTTDVRALQKPGATDRIASAWYGGNFTIDINLTDGNQHQVAFYCVDWENAGRAQTMTVQDATSGAVLDTRSLSGFTNGEWVAWNLTGHVKIVAALTAGSNAVVSGAFFDPLGAPDFYLTAAPSSQTVTKGASASYTVTVGSADGFSGAVNLSVSGLPSGATASLNPTSVNTSGTSTLTVNTTATTQGGTYAIKITGTSGALSHATAVTLVIPVTTSAGFVKTDTTTQGTWEGVYGANGYSIANYVNSYPAYATVSLSGQSNFTWLSSTTDARALQKPGATDRIASTWYSGSSFTIDINLTDGNQHQVALYGVDWDNLGRAETLTVADAVSGNTLDTQSLAGFTGGTWVVWNLTGHVKITMTRTGGSNAVVSGLFFDPLGGPDFYLSATPSSQTVTKGASTSYTVNVGAANGFSGAVGLSASGLPNGATASFNPTSVNAPGTSTLTVNTTPTTQGGTYAVKITGASGSLSHTATVTLVIPVPNAAAFVQSDTTTQGTWEGVYGVSGYAIANLVNNYPAFAAVNVSGQSNYTWLSSTSDVRALQKPGATDRVASTWYSSTSFNIDVNLTDGNQHQVGIYCVDWENAGRAQMVTILDAATGATLDTQSLSAFSNGEWLIWNVTGHVTMQVTRTGGNNAVVSGVFFNN